MNNLLSILLLIALNLYNYLVFKERFRIPVYKAHNVYQKYRDYIDGNYGYNYLFLNNNHYKISDNCFSDKYEKCNNLYNYKYDDYCKNVSLELCKFNSPL